VEVIALFFIFAGLFWLLGRLFHIQREAADLTKELLQEIRSLRSSLSEISQVEGAAQTSSPNAGIEKVLNPDETVPRIP